MMTCRDLQPMLAERASGPAAPDVEAAVSAHFAGCASCRAEADSLAELFARVRSPPPSAAEEQAALHLPGRLGAMATALARSRARPVASRLAFPVAAAAAVTLAVALPAGFWHPSSEGGATPRSRSPHAASSAARAGARHEPTSVVDRRLDLDLAEDSEVLADWGMLDDWDEAYAYQDVE